MQNLWNFEDLSCFCKSVGHKQIHINFDLIFQIFETIKFRTKSNGFRTNSNLTPPFRLSRFEILKARLRTLHNLEHLGDYLLALYALPALEDLLL